ncbi:MAG: galactokinase [Bacteroidales bacterium]|nr:galactokinase [Bacteroidales bacterium]
MQDFNTIIQNLQRKFTDLFQLPPDLYQAPGRINLIGEHTDYNDGFVLPAAIDKAIYLAILKNDLEKLRLFSYNMDEFFEIDIHELKKVEVQWANYLIGVTAQFQKKGLNPGGIDCVFGGNIPPGAGLSSSAALECGFAAGINDQFDFGIEKTELIRMAQKAEHEYAGVLCGIMDQFASTFGKEGYVMKLDCRSLDYEYFPLTNQEVDIVLCDTRVEHSLASSEYNIRRSECDKGVKTIQSVFPDVKSLRDADPAMLDKVKTRMKTTIYDRCHYIIHENIRVEKACKALLKNDFSTFGKLMYETHAGLSKEYMVSCIELDTLVDIAKKSPDISGARMMGGGFGGCTINLVKKGKAEKFISLVNEEYKKTIGSTIQIYRVKTSDGAGKLN